MASPMRILHLEDDPKDAELVKAILAGNGIACKTTIVETGEAFKSALEREQIDLILADYNLPSYSGLDALKLATSTRPEIPFIFVSGTIGEEFAVLTLHMGATDYVLKKNLARLPAAVRRALKEAEATVTRMRMEESLRLHATRMKSIMETSLDAIIVMDSHGVILDWNNQATSIFGWSKQDVLGRTVAETIVPPQHREAHTQGLKRYMATGEGPVLNRRIEITALHRTGREFPIELAITVTKVQDQWQFTAFIVDITERKKADAKFQGLLEAAPDALVIVNQAGRIALVNAAAEQLFGYQREELLGQPVEIVVPQRFHARHEVHRTSYHANAQRRPMGSGRELFARRKDGSEIAVEISLSPIDTGEGLLVTAAIRDITERKEAEEAKLAKLSAERANHAKSEFLSRMSHELRTPLNAVLGFAQLLEMDSLNPEQREHVQQILKGGRHLLALINEVLDIARIEAGRMTLSLEAVSISSVLGEAVDLIRPQAAGRKIQLVIQSAWKETIYVLADRQRLKQVLLNLLSNGVKYNREGGTLTVSGQAVPEDRYRMTVTDTGGGIPATMMSRLFTPFDRLEADSRTEGTGLGLVLSRSLMTAMEGTVFVESVVGQGTTVSVELPLSEAPAALTAASAVSEKGPVPSPAPGPGVTILYIEDNLPNFQLVERLIEKRPGFRLLSAMQGKLGVELAVSHRPDLILLDLNLPDIQGDEVLLRLREHPETAGIPVVMLSADAMPKQIDKLLAAGAQRYLTKPIEVAQFYALLDEFIAKKGGE